MKLEAFQNIRSIFIVEKRDLTKKKQRIFGQYEESLKSMLITEEKADIFDRGRGIVKKKPRIPIKTLIQKI